MHARMVAAAALIAGSLALLKAGQPPLDEGACAPDPSITLNAPTAKGKTIQGSGTFNRGKMDFKSITLTAMPKGSGDVLQKTLTTEPTGLSWPDMGTLDLDVPYNTTYKVWAILTVNDGTRDRYFGSGLREVTVMQGGGATPYIAWGASQPTAAGGSITGSGTFTIPNGSTNRSVTQWVWQATGGEMFAKPATRDETQNPPTWGPVAQGNFTPGTAYNVMAILNYTSGGFGLQTGTTIATKTP